jgi:hypothetical protein
MAAKVWSRDGADAAGRITAMTLFSVDCAILTPLMLQEKTALSSCKISK